MVRGLYTAWTGMRNEQKRLDVISNNVANAATTGFKTEYVTSQSFDDMLKIKVRDRSENYDTDERIGKVTLGVKIGQEYTDYDQGSLRETGNTYDLAIDGSGFFRVRVVDIRGNEHIRYTRAGNFTINNEGIIMDADGNRLQGEGGDIIVPTEAADVVIDEHGAVYANGEFVDNVDLTDFEDYKYLKKFADTMYEPVDGATEVENATGLIRQGYLEQSNVNVVRQMTNLIVITRAYEANQKVIQTMDSTLDQAVNSVGRVS
ncbi:MAG: flagellar hook-basal body protein [Lachnospiraceae bacterium]|jgi:flagellar basal-body rod protein FlgG|nr:flagellar hook-basal body protein [Lachnospiraceae bacterium]